MDALAFLAKATKSKRQPVYVFSGDEDYLKRLCREAIVAAVLGDADPTFAVASYPGDKLDFSTVRNDLDTLPFLSPARVVVVDAADPFVTAHREQLEKYAAAPSTIGVLILDVKSFPETTKLAKALPDGAKLVCKAPPPYKLADWCREWAKSRHDKALAPDAAEVLVELVGPHLGLLDQELAKLSVAAGPAVTADDVARLVGRTRAANAFRILDAVGEGSPAAALGLVADLFADGEDAFAILGMLTSQLRKLAAVQRHLGQGLALGPALDAAGVAKWPQARQAAERQLRHLGRARLDPLTGWLTETGMGFRGGNPLPPRLQLERLIVKLARPRSN